MFLSENQENLENQKNLENQENLENLENLENQENQWVPVGTSAVGTSAVGTSGYQEYQEDQDQISGATYISDAIIVPSVAQLSRI